MSLNPQIIDELYQKYGYRSVFKGEKIRLYLYEKGRYFGADIIPLDNETDTQVAIEVIKKEYGDGGYAAQIKAYKSNDDVANELYKSFFAYEETKKRIDKTYNVFIENQKRLNGGYKYEYLNSPFRINNETDGDKGIIDHVVDNFKSIRPQLIIIEAAAGYGKTCTAYEIFKKSSDCKICGNPLMTVLSRNRGASIFRYVLLDEIDREYPSLDSKLVTYEIQTGRIPLIIDGFDELLNKSEIVKSEKDKVFSEVETMLDTIGTVLKHSAKVILTSRKTAIFAGEDFQNWLSKWNSAFDVTRYSIEIPRIKDWLNNEKHSLIKQSQIPVEYIANPVLLTYLRNLDINGFNDQIKEPETIIKKYFQSLLEREMTRQELKIKPDDQYQIFKNVVKLLIQLDQSTTDRKFFKEIILDENKEILEESIKLYPQDKTVEWLADKLVTHALLDRKGNDENAVGFINEFVFGTFIGEIMSEASIVDVETDFSSYMVELGATAYRVQNVQNKTSLWEKIGILDKKFESSTLFTFDITLKGRLERNFDQTIFQSLSVFKIDFTNDFVISSSVFISCTFKSCKFFRNAFDSVSFIDCSFDQCSVEGVEFLNDLENSCIINCHQSNCGVISSIYEDKEISENACVDFENRILKELFNIDRIFKSQRILHIMKKFKKSEHRMISISLDKMEKEKLIKVVGSDMYIEINRISDVKKRIGAL